MEEGDEGAPQSKRPKTCPDPSTVQASKDLPCHLAEGLSPFALEAALAGQSMDAEYEAVDPEFYHTGNTSVVTKVRRRSDGKQFAVKTIHIYDLEARAAVAHELQMLQRVRAHPNVVQLERVYYDQWDAHCVQTLCTGGELFDTIIDVGHFSEAQAAFLFRQVVAAVEHCHRQGVCHRDVKPEVLAPVSRCTSLNNPCLAEFAVSRGQHAGGDYTLIVAQTG